MACPTCDHTMALISTDPPAFHCGRCGTLAARSVKDADGPFKYIYTPTLIERCRKYEAEFDKENIAQFYRNTWKRLGISESINKPKEAQ